MEKNEKTNLVFLQETKSLEKTKDINSYIEKPNFQIKKTRYFIFDNFKGILIFTVVFAHFLLDYSNRNMNSLERKIVVFIYSFHMQGFAFISGFLTSDNTIKIKNTIKLLIIYYIFNFSLSVILHFYIYSPINFILPVNSYWYLLSLFYWRISIKYLYNLKFIFIFSVIIYLLEGYWDCFTNVLSIRRTIAFFPYFLAGYKISRKKKFGKFITLKKGFFKFIVSLFFFFIFSYKVILYIKRNNISNSTLLMSNYNETNTIKERIIIMIISSIMILLFLLLLPNTKIPILNKFGKNSLYIFLFHRLLTILAQKEFFRKKRNCDYIIEYSFLFTLIILFVFSSDIFSKYFDSILYSIHKNFTESEFKRNTIFNIFYSSFIIILMIKPVIFYYQLKKYNRVIIDEINENITYQFMNSIRISYVGDLILLKDQIIGGKNNLTGKYEFDGMFQFTSKHFHQSDLSIGVYEGPSAGNNTSFSTSNYDDGIPLYLNFPDEFVEAIKNAGINLVTTANNHLLDKKLKGAMRTLDILDKYNISHVGSYRNHVEKNKIFTIKLKGIKIAVLSYTSIMNNYKMEYLYEKYNYLTNIIPKRNNKYYKQIYILKILFYLV